MPVIKGHSFKRSIQVNNSVQGQGHTMSSQSDDSVPYLNRRTFFNGSTVNAIRIDYDRVNRPGYDFDNLGEINGAGQFIPQQTGIYCFNIRFQVYDSATSGRIQGIVYALRDESPSPVVGSTQGFQRLIYSFVCPYPLSNDATGMEQFNKHQTFLHKCVSGATYAVYAAGFHASNTTTSNIRTFGYNQTYPQNLIVVHWVSEA